MIWSLAGMGHGVDKIEERLVQYPNGIAAKYAGRLREEIERCYAKWESANDTGTTGATWDDPDWSLLDDRRGTLPDFPAGVLSDKWEEWLARAAHGAGVTHGHVAVPLLATVASLIGTARRIRPSRSWSEPFTLWTAIVGFSGSGKTPGISVTKRALSLIESTRKDQDCRAAAPARHQVANRQGGGQGLEGRSRGSRRGQSAAATDAGGGNGPRPVRHPAPLCLGGHD